MEGVIAILEYIVIDEPKADLRDVLIASDGQAVALSDGEHPTKVSADGTRAATASAK